MPGWIRKNGAYRQISVPGFYELATSTMVSGGTGYTTSMQIVVNPVATGDQGAVIAIDDVGENGVIVASHIASRGKYASATSITSPTFSVTGGEHTGTDATFTLTSEDYTGLNTAVFARMNDEWQPINAAYMKKGNNWRLIYEPAPAEPNPPEPVVTAAVKYMAIAPDGTVSVSDDGYAYTEASTIESSSTGRILFYCDDGYYYTAIKNGATSDAKRTKDGVTWESLNVPNNLGMAVFAKGGDGRYMFANKNDNKFYYTDDPVNGDWQSFYIANTGLDWNSLFWADLGTGNQYWYVSAATSTTAYRFLVGGTISAITLSNKASYGKLAKVENLLYYPFYVRSTTGGSTVTIISHWVSWDGVTFSKVHSYGQNVNTVRGSDALVFNNGVYCSARTNESYSVFSYVVDGWTKYAMPSQSVTLAALTGNFCSFHPGTVAGESPSVAISMSPDGQHWTSTVPTFPETITEGSVYSGMKVGLRMYWVHSVSGTYTTVLGTTDGSTFSIVSGLDPTMVNSVAYGLRSVNGTVSENSINQGYALASKMG